VIEYKYRGLIYGLIIGFFLIPFLMCRLNFTQQDLQKTAIGKEVVYHYPMFIFGVILADMET
jgi:hypothetical protein